MKYHERATIIANPKSTKAQKMRNETVQIR